MKMKNFTRAPTPNRYWFRVVRGFAPRNSEQKEAAGTSLWSFISKKILALGFVGIFSLVFLIGAPSVLAQPVDPPPGIVEFVNPLKYDTVEDVLYNLLNTLQGIIVVISIIFIVIGAIIYITSTGDEKRITMAKAAITASMIGLAVGIAAPSFLREISDILGWKSSDILESCDINENGTIDPGAEQTCVDALTESLTLAEIALNTLNFLLSVVGVLAIIMLVWGGVMYLTAAGNEKRIDTAKNIVTWSIIGIAIALAAMVIVRQIANFFM